MTRVPIVSIELIRREAQGKYRSKLRESSKLDKTKLPGDTYEKWLGAQPKGPGRSGDRETPAKDSYESWIEKRVETKLKQTKAK